MLVYMLYRVHHWAGDSWLILGILCMVYNEFSALTRYIAKLEQRGGLSTAAQSALHALPTRTRSFKIHQDIAREGDRPTHCCLVATGLVSRYKSLPTGSRQIVSFQIPGDMVDLQSLLVIVADHGIHTHTATTIVTIAHDDLAGIAAQHPDLARALWFDTLVDAAICREWTTNVGRRDARQRLAHLLLELAVRFKAARLMAVDTFELPLTQADLADATGMTAVHVNRTLQWLRGERLIRTDGRNLTIENWDAMKALAGFDATYLHMEGPRIPKEDLRIVSREAG